MNQSKKIYNVMVAYHKTENVAKLIVNVDEAVNFCLQK
jgi:hypothetical protein